MPPTTKPEPPAKPEQAAAKPEPAKSLRDEALAALAGRKQAQADEEAAMEQARQDAALTRVAKSQLKGWFPGVKWTFVGDLSDGTTMVREEGGLDTVLGITPVYNDDKHPEGAGPDSWSVAVYTKAVGVWTKGWQLNEPADLGAYLEATEPKPALDVTA